MIDRLWGEIAIIGLLTFAVRLSFIALLGRITPSPDFERTLSLVPVAVLVAIIVPAVVGAPAATGLSVARILAGVVAIVVAWRTHRAVPTILAGMATLLIGEWLLGL